MGFGSRRSNDTEPEPVVVDPTGWMIDSPVADFLLMHTNEIRYMCMLGYTFMHGSKVFNSAKPDASIAYKFVNMILACTGGGIFVPIFINKIPVPLAQDAYIIAILTSFMLHTYAPVLREVLTKSGIFLFAGVFSYETLRSYVVCSLTAAAGAAIAPSQFSFPVFGPIICGTVAGCGGAFLPLNKGLEPIKGGLAPPMLTAFLGSAFYHLFLNTSVSEGCIEPGKKAHFHVALFFVLVGLANAFGATAKVKKS